MAILTIWEKAIRLLRMFREVIEWKDSFATITLLFCLIFHRIKILIGLKDTSTFGRTAPTFVEMRFRNSEQFVAYRASDGYLVVIP